MTAVREDDQLWQCSNCRRIVHRHGFLMDLIVYWNGCQRTVYRDDPSLCLCPPASNTIVLHNEFNIHQYANSSYVRSPYHRLSVPTSPAFSIIHPPLRHSTLCKQWKLVSHLDNHLARLLKPVWYPASCQRRPEKPAAAQNAQEGLSKLRVLAQSIRMEVNGFHRHAAPYRLVPLHEPDNLTASSI